VKQKLYCNSYSDVTSMINSDSFYYLVTKHFCNIYFVQYKINKPTDSIERSPLRSNSFSSDRGTPIIYFFPQPHKSSLRCASICWKSILSPHLCLGLPSGLFPSVFPTRNLYAAFLSPVCAICSVWLTYSFWFYHSDNIRWGAWIIKLITI
jgi:hypothetical protein